MTYILTVCHACLWFCPSSLCSPIHQRSSTEIKKQHRCISGKGLLHIYNSYSLDLNDNQRTSTFFVLCVNIFISASKMTKKTKRHCILQRFLSLSKKRDQINELSHQTVFVSSSYGHTFIVVRKNINPMAF